MFDRAPEFFDPLEFVEKNRRIRGRLPLALMERLEDRLMSREGEAEVELEFRRKGNVAAIEGRVTAALMLQCQCCMEALAWPVRSVVRLGVVSSLDEADRLSGEFEPLLVEAGASVALADIVQDELLLALPAIPQHPDCHPPSAGATADATEKNPFAVLAQLKNHS